MPTPKEFLDALWYGVTGQFALVRIFDDRGEGKPTHTDMFFEWPSEAEGLLKVLEAPGGLAYIGAGLRSERSAARDKVSSVSAFWATINLDDVSFDRAVTALKQFPAKPSAGILLGKVLHAVWFIKESLGPIDLDLVWAANRTIYPKLFLGGLNAHYDLLLCRAGLQAYHYDFDGLIRAPGQPDAKSVAWRPEARYTIDEFTDLVCPKRQEPAPASSEALAPVAPPQQEVLKKPDFRFNTEDLAGIIEKFRGVWFEGGNGSMAMCVAGMFARAGVVMEQAKEVVSAGVKHVAGDLDRRLREVENTYRRFFDEGKEIYGANALETFIEDQFQSALKKAAKKVVTEVKKMLPEPPWVKKTGKGCDPDFEVPLIIKFDSRPARYLVLIRRIGPQQAPAVPYESNKHDDMKVVDIVETLHAVGVPCEIEAYTDIKRFRKAFTESTPDSQNIAAIKQARWEEMYSKAPHLLKAAPQEATVAGSIKAKLEGFLEEARENPELGDLKTFPGRSEQEFYFKLDTFRRRLRDAGVKVSDREITHVLKDDEWKDDRRRIGNGNPRLWVKSIVEGGGGNGNGHGAPPPKPSPEVTSDLFGLNEVRTPEEGAVDDSDTSD